MTEVTVKSSQPNASGDPPNWIRAISSLAQGSRRIPLKILAFAILVVAPIALQISIVLPEINRRAPYEDWDEIAGYNHSRPMSHASSQRVVGYGSLDTFKFAVAREWHRLLDREAQSLQDPLWTNAVPDSFRDYKLLVGPKTWAGFAAIDYNYARGICDRSVIITTRKVGFILSYLIVGVIAGIIIYTLGFPGVSILIATECYLFSQEFRWYVVRALPGAQSALLGGFIFIVLLIGLQKQSFKFLHLATVLCAISANFKVDSLIMAVPISVSYLLLHLYLFRKIALKRFTIVSIHAICIFLIALVLTNLEMLLRPIRTVKSQIFLLTAVSYGSVDLRLNWHLFELFLHNDLVPLFLRSSSPDGFTPWIFLFAGIVVIGTGFIFASSLSPSMRGCMILVTILTLITLWGIPIIHLPVMYGRYLTTGLFVFFAAIGYSCYLFIISHSGRLTALGWGILLLSLIAIIINSQTILVAAQLCRRQLAANSGLDPNVSRNRAVLEMWRLTQTGEYDDHVLIDQHSYTDIRFLYDRGLHPVMINAWNYGEILTAMQKREKPVLGLYVPGSYNDKAVPRWMGIWSPADQQKYNEYLRMLSSLHRVYNFEGTIMRLLDWSPVLHDNSVCVFKIDPHTNGTAY